MNILHEANEITGGERHESYGHPRPDFTRTAMMWTSYLSAKYPGVELTAEDVPLMMILLKVSREANKHKRDNLVDIAGYARTREMLDEAPPTDKTENQNVSRPKNNKGVRVSRPRAK